MKGVGMEIGNRPQHERYPYDIFEEGDRACMPLYTDILPCTVVKVERNGSKVTVRSDSYKLNPEVKPDFHPGGFAGHVSNMHELKWDITENPQGSLTVFTLRKWRGRYVWTPAKNAPDGIQRLQKGWRARYDYNF